MRKQIIEYSFLVMAMFLSLFSCTKEVDFDQADDLEITPVVTSSLIFFDEPIKSFLLNGVEIPPVIDHVDVEIFNEQFVVDNLVKAEFVFETTNTINKEFQIEVRFLNDAGTELHAFSVLGASSTDGSEVTRDYTEELVGDKLEALKNTTRMEFILSLLPGGDVNQNRDGRIKIKSHGIFYFKIGDL
ncbi:hypothetical protein [Flavivirga eckloniae]|uniref:Uncharacterized protein n=1 Tax=Flavivirga eckloniae TaxID=1803846 RepID=A0A2K9PTD8_9FLAO|nr:hypothetical protein [Flavivirga eckloniae]AUP80330.1 hypothetical protein C1H87_17090 [Flavivirga eckloniae]